MIEVSGIFDQESLKALVDARPDATRQADAVVIACRAALRVMPFFLPKSGSRADFNNDWSGLPILRKILTALVAYKYPGPALGDLAQDLSGLNTSEMADFETSRSSNSYGSARFAVRAAGQFAKYSPETARAAVLSVEHAGAVGIDALSFGFLKRLSDALRLDFSFGDSKNELIHTKLWSDTSFSVAMSDWPITRDFLREIPGYGFWIRWCEAALEGRPLTGDWGSHWQMLRDIALIPNDDWEQGAEHIAGRIDIIAEKNYI